jgi:epoxyqueuosine reductase QueG
MKEKIRQYALDLGADLVGFTSLQNYHSPRSDDPRKILPGANSLVVLGLRLIDGALDCPDPRITFSSAMLDTESTGRDITYRLCRYLEKDLGCRALPTPAPPRYPMEMSQEKKGFIGPISVRHAAVAAGLGVLGKNNLIVNPRIGCRGRYLALLTTAQLESDPPIRQDLCGDCDLCLKACPPGALDDPGQTDERKCISYCQPFGLGGLIKFIGRFVEADLEGKKNLLRTPNFWNIHQTFTLGQNVQCHECIRVCPLGQAKNPKNQV